MAFYHCNKCDQDRHETHFYPTQLDLKTAKTCRDCMRRYKQRNRAQKEPEKLERKIRRLQRLYPGISRRDAIRAGRKGQCGICKRFEILVPDHCHTGGFFRGMLCKRCNRGLGMFLDSPESLRRAARYIERFKDFDN